MRGNRELLAKSYKRYFGKEPTEEELKELDEFYYTFLLNGYASDKE